MVILQHLRRVNMGLVTMEEAFALAEDKGAIGAFSTYDLYSAMGIIEGAERVNMPVIAMIGAPVLNVPQNEYIVKNMVALAKESKVPVVVHLDHAKDLATCIKAIRLGSSSVMIDGSTLSLEENISLTNKVKEVAKSVGVSIEAELGALAGIEDGEEEVAQKMTDPSHVKRFVDETEVDALAVSIGNAHGLYKGEPKLNFELLKEIESISSSPLVLHGGTGLSLKQFAKAVSLGIKKINIGTEVKREFIEAFVASHKKAPQSYDLIGIPQDCKESVAKMVADKLKFFGEKWKEQLAD